ncbi:MAG: hypothetical protein HUJ80_00635 [Firmicutes bacterium]|nr:hypothetical protein [Bacillota bacterium]
MAYFGQNQEEKKGLNSLYLRCTGVVLTVVYLFCHYLKPQPGLTDLLCWPAVMLFCFLLAEGVLHTQDKWIYYIRLLLFALLAEIPFNLLNFGTRINTDLQNFLFTLLLCYCLLYGVDFIRLRTDNLAATLLAELIALTVGIDLSQLLHLQFGPFAVLCSILCYISVRVTYSNWMRIAGLLAICFNLPGVETVSIALSSLRLTVPETAAAFPALLLIAFYNGKRGTNDLRVRYASYLFYPVVTAFVALLSYSGITI